MTKRGLCFAFAVCTAGIVWVGCSGKSEDAPALVNTDAGGGGEVDSGGPPPTPAKDSGADADSSAPDASKAGVEIKYGTCEPFTKCGGDLPGVWKVTGGCLSKATFDKVRESCPEFQESNVVIKARGTISFTDTTVKRDTAIDVSGKATIPVSCSPLPSCDLIAAGLKSGLLEGSPKFDTATCVADGPLCKCDVATTVVEVTESPYTKPDATSVKAGESTYDYCVKGANRLEFTETTASAGLALLIELGK